MKITIGQLKRVIKEAVRKEGGMMSRSDIADTISSAEPGEVALEDFLDDETGEIVIEKGQTFLDSSDQELDVPFDDDLNDDFGGEDFSGSAAPELDAKIASFIDGLSGYVGDEVDSTSAFDLADSFMARKSEWVHLARELGLSHEDVKMKVAEMISDELSVL